MLTSILIWYPMCLVGIMGVVYQLGKRHPAWKKGLVVLTSVAITVYLLFRVQTIPFTLGFFNVFFGSGLLLAELIGILSFLLFEYLFLVEHRKEAQPTSLAHALPSVDILIPTYNEEASVLEKTIAAAMDQDYPQDKFVVYVCDDGNRPWVKELATLWGAKYLTRTNPTHAKAGNLNHALTFAHGELFTVLDADMIAKRITLKTAVPYFEDERMGFVQFPQSYYNPDIYQQNLNPNLPNEQDFFMQQIQARRAQFNAVLHVGTNVFFRRSVVEKVGGYPTFSITEDMALGQAIQAAGYLGQFVPEVVVIGLSAERVSELVKQRDRWCRGNLQVYKRQNPWRQKGLSLVQRLIYQDALYYWLGAFQKMMFLLAPIVFLAFQSAWIDAHMAELLYYYLPVVVGMSLVFRLLSRRKRSLLSSHVYESLMAPFLLFSLIKEGLQLPVRFEVTDKTNQVSASFIPWKLMWPHALLIGLSIVALLLGSVALQAQRLNWLAYGVSTLWTLYNVLGLFLAIQASRVHRNRRVEQRIVSVDALVVQVRTAAMNQQAICTLLDFDSHCVGLTASDLFTHVNQSVALFLEGEWVSGVVLKKGEDKVVVRMSEAHVERKHYLRFYVSHLHPFQPTQP